MCGHNLEIVIYPKFHQNPFKGFEATRCQNLSCPIDLASGVYNSSYYCTSRDDANDDDDKISYFVCAEKLV